MKPTTQQICEILEKPELSERYGQLTSTNGSYVCEESTLEEGYAEFERFSELILGTAKRGFFDKITFKKRNEVLSHVKNIDANLKHCQQYAYNAQQCVSQFNALIVQTFAVSAILEESNLFLKSLGIRGKKKLTDVLAQTFDQYNGFLNDLSESKQCFSELSDIDEQVRQMQENMENVKTDIVKIQEEASQFLTQIASHQEKSSADYQKVTKIAEGAESLVNSIRTYEEEAEEKRLGIETFSRNIDDYKKRISDLENKANAIIEKEKKINDLIQSAEHALNLRSAEGISAAFASQYETASSWKIATLWLSASFVFIAVAVGFVVWLALGHFDIDSHGISSIIARIVAVAIVVTAATFCAKQYIKQKNIAEDYAYKAVLSKSIIAFTDKLKEKSAGDSTIVAEYLEKVLEEIHQDPLRQRNTKEEHVPVIATSDLLSTLPDLLKKLMETAGKK